jgi:hypothetical protein
MSDKVSESGNLIPNFPVKKPKTLLTATWVVVFLLLVVIVLLTRQNYQLKKQNAQIYSGPGSNSAAESQELSTPELIEQDFTQGEITAQQRLLYLAYAVGDYERLPARYRGNVHWRSSLTHLELTEAVTSPTLMCSLSPDVQNELRRILTEAVECE